MIDDEIRHLLETKAEALIRRDAATLDTLLDPDFTYLNAGGRILDKARFIETYCTSGQVAFLSQQATGLRVTPHDGFAVATFSLRDRFRFGERVIEGDYRSLCVFKLVDGQWRWAAGQTMPSPPA